MATSKFPVNKDAGTSGIANRTRSAVKRPFTNYDSEDSEDEVNESAGTSRNVHLTGLRSTENFEKNQHCTAPKRMKFNDAFKKPCWWMSKDYKEIAECNTDSLKIFVDGKNLPDGAVSSRLKNLI